MRTFNRFLSIPIGFIFLFSASQVFAKGPVKAESIDQLMKIYHEYGLFNGSVLVVENGTLLFKSGYGYANMEWEIPNAPDTKFRLGSITKQFTSMLIMQLVSEGKIKLEDPLSNYLDYYRKDTGTKITIHQLLNHTSGIPSYTGFTGFFKNESRDPYKPDEFIKKYCSNDLEFEPGSTFRYNNSGYFILGGILEKVTGKSYAKLLEERIFQPLKMSSSGYDLHGPIIKKRAAGYEKRNNGYVNASYLDMSIPYAAGSLYASAEDLFTWDRALYTNQLLSKELMQKMFTPNLENYGYGWGIRSYEINEVEKVMVSHGGGINGFNTLINRMINDQHMIVLLNNTGGTKLNEISKQIQNILYGLKVEMPKKPVFNALLKEYSEKGLQSGQDLIKKFDKEGGYDLAENTLNRLGYELMGMEKFEEAISIFKYNVKLYPDSANTYDSLAEGYMNHGNNEKAVQYYKKTLELSPENPNAVQQLKKLGVE